MYGILSSTHKQIHSMKKLLSLLTAVLVVTLLSAQTKTIFINSKKADCVGAAPMKCFQYKEKATATSWKNWYGSIKNFTYKEGNFYTLLIKEKKLANTAADASAIEWQLVKIIKQIKDTTKKYTAMLDKYVFVNVMVNDALIDLTGTKATLTLDKKASKVFGKGTCNNFFGGMVLIETDKNNGKLSFGPLASTLMACPNTINERAIFSALEKVTGYTVINNQLILKNNDKVIATLTVVAN